MLFDALTGVAVCRSLFVVCGLVVVVVVCGLLVPLAFNVC